jgi:heme-degrading monooxygenase HmoA
LTSVGWMILEHAVITIRPGSARGFEAALATARPIIASSKGFISLELHRGIETPEQYILTVRWETVDDHLVGFRQSERFARWRELIGPYFESPPVGIHLTPVDLPA